MDNDPISLAKLIGTDILAKIPAFRGNNVITLKLLGVEAGGIWVESQDFMEEMFASTEHTMTPKTFALFLPFAQILVLYALADFPWISKRVAE